MVPARAIGMNATLNTQHSTLNVEVKRDDNPVACQPGMFTAKGAKSAKKERTSDESIAHPAPIQIMQKAAACSPHWFFALFAHFAVNNAD